MLKLYCVSVSRCAFLGVVSLGAPFLWLWLGRMFLPRGFLVFGIIRRRPLVVLLKACPPNAIRTPINLKLVCHFPSPWRPKAFIGFLSSLHQYTLEGSSGRQLLFVSSVLFAFPHTSHGMLDRVCFPAFRSLVGWGFRFGFAPCLLLLHLLVLVRFFYSMLVSVS